MSVIVQSVLEMIHLDLSTLIQIHIPSYTESLLHAMAHVVHWTHLSRKSNAHWPLQLYRFLGLKRERFSFAFLGKLLASMTRF